MKDVKFGELEVGTKFFDLPKGGDERDLVEKIHPLPMRPIPGRTECAKCGTPLGEWVNVYDPVFGRRHICPHEIVYVPE